MSDSSQILIEKTENEFNFPTELDGFIHLLILNNHFQINYNKIRL